MSLTIRFLNMYARQGSSRIAVLNDAQAISYQDILHLVMMNAWKLRLLGVGVGSIVAVSVKEELEHFILSLALLAVGARQTTLASHESLEVKRRLVKLLNPSIEITDSEPLPFIQKAIRMQSIGGRGSLGWNDEEWAPAGGGSLLLRTSGTTGGMNIVELTEEDLMFQARRHAEYQVEKLLRLASIEHNNSKRHRMYVFFQGGTNVFKGRDPERWTNYIDRGLVTALDISRMHAQDLLARFKAGELRGLKIRTGGSAIPVELRNAMREGLSDKIYVRYATTEFGGVAMAGPGMHSRHGCAGLPLDGVEIRIVGEDGEQRQRGKAGLICLKGEGAAKGFAFSEDKSAAERRFRGGFFYPGDLGRIEEDGALIIEGRQDEMMIMNGLNIYPDEVQAVLEAITGIRQAACFPVNSAVHGQIPVAAVVRGQGPGLSEPEILALARSKLGLKCPRKIYFVDTIPANSAGKMDKIALAVSLAKHRH